MGRSLPIAVTSLVNAQNILSRFATLQVNWPQGATSRWAGTRASVNGVIHTAHLLRTSPLRMSSGAPVDRCEIVVSNVDLAVTRLTESAAFYDATPKAIVGQLLRAPDAAATDPWEWLQIFTGEVIAGSADHEEASLQIVADIYAAGQVGATGTTRKSCRWRYRDPETCGYVGPLPECSFSYAGPNGCGEHFNQHHFGGFLIDTDAETLLLPAPDLGGGGGSGGGAGGGSITDPGYRKFEPDIY